MREIVEEYPKIVFGANVDDMSYSREDENEDALVDELVKVHELVQA